MAAELNVEAALSGYLVHFPPLLVERSRWSDYLCTAMDNALLVPSAAQLDSSSDRTAAGDCWYSEENASITNSTRVITSHCADTHCATLLTQPIKGPVATELVFFHRLPRPMAFPRLMKVLAGS